MEQSCSGRSSCISCSRNVCRSHPYIQPGVRCNPTRGLQTARSLARHVAGCRQSQRRYQQLAVIRCRRSRLGLPTLQIHTADIAASTIAFLPYTMHRCETRKLVLMVMLVPTCREQPLAGHMPNLPLPPSSPRGRINPTDGIADQGASESPASYLQPSILHVTRSKPRLPLLPGTETDTRTTDAPNPVFHSLTRSLSGNLRAVSAWLGLSRPRTRVQAFTLPLFVH